MGSTKPKAFLRNRRVVVGVMGLALATALVCGSLALIEPDARSSGGSGATPRIVPSILVLA
jgi:hypothetical protein